MHPELFRIPIPEFLQGFLPSHLTIHSYGALIALGALLGYFYTAYQANKQFAISSDTIRNLVIVVIIAAVVGGRFFFFFEKPDYFFDNPSNMLSFSSSGFVFYGSLIFAIPAMLWFFKIHKMPVLPMLDIMGITACIVHGFGRLGCFSAGCCHGVNYDGPFSLVFSDPLCRAPLDTPLFPTQPLSAGMIFSILLILVKVKKHRRFEGQVFLTYVGLYAVGRSILEVFRGDYQRGYIIEGWLTHSQFISIILIVIIVYYYIRLWNKPESELPATT